MGEGPRGIESCSECSTGGTLNVTQLHKCCRSGALQVNGEMKFGCKMLMKS